MDNENIVDNILSNREKNPLVIDKLMEAMGFTEIEKSNKKIPGRWQRKEMATSLYEIMSNTSSVQLPKH